jgi:CBS domain-containing protein
MQTISEILNAKGGHVWTIAPGDTIFDAVRLMAEKGIGALLVMDGDKPVGLVTERDYARRVALEGRSSKTAAVREIMSSRVICVRPERTVDDCMALMTDKRVRHLPVLDHKQVVGIVSIGDLVKAVIAEQQFMIDQLHEYITGYHLG